jgi:hypothetical protein
MGQPTSRAQRRSETINKQLTAWFPDEDDDVQNAAFGAAQVIMSSCPDGPDRNAALRSLRDAVFWASESRRLL